MEPQLDEPDLRSYVSIIAGRRWFVVAVTLVFVGVALAVSLIPPPQYRVRAQVLTIESNDPVALIFGQNATADLDRSAAAQASFLTSSEMRFAAARAYNGSLDDSEVYKVSARSVTSDDNNQRASGVVELSLVSTDPNEAATLLNVYARSYVRLREAKDQEKLIAVMSRSRAYLDDLDAEIAAVKKPLDEFDEQIKAAGSTLEIDSLQQTRDNKEAELRPRLDSLYAQQSSLTELLGNLEFGINLSAGGGASVLSLAGVPDTPVSPNLPLNLAIGLVFGLFLGSILAFLRDYFDDSVKTKEMVEKVTGVTTLGLIPKIANSDELVTVEQPSSPAAEAFRSLRTSVKFLGVDRQVRAVQVTSPSPGEGKTMVAVNLAVAFAQSGERVVLVGGDLRRPRVEEVLDVPLTPGLTAVLIGDVTLPQAIQTVSSVPNLSVLPSGYPPPNPSELLSGERARRLIDVLGQTYDVVVIDCPPVLPVTDSLVIARMVDTTLLVTSANKTSKRGLQRAVELLRQVNAPLVGSVLNSLAPDATFGGEPYRYETVSRAPRRRPSADDFDDYDDEGPADEGGGRVRGRGRGDDTDMWEPAPPAHN